MYFAEMRITIIINTIIINAIILMSSFDNDATATRRRQID